MNILIRLATDNELIAYEALALAFTLASFDHTIQLFISKPTHLLLTDTQSRIYGMIQSLDLYDIPKAWHDFDDETLGLFDEPIRASLTAKQSCFDDNSALFESMLTF